MLSLVRRPSWPNSALVHIIPAEIVSYVARLMTLLPGDVICTGTPQGVGMGRSRFLKPGDRVRLGVQGLGEQAQTVIAETKRD